MSSTEENDDSPQLSASALSALKSFYTERDAREKQFEDLKAAAEHEFSSSPSGAAPTPVPISMDSFAEDWNASQFWYDDATARTLAHALLNGAVAGIRVAVVSAPSVFVALRNLLAEEHSDSGGSSGEERKSEVNVTLLEYDERFAVFREFVRYDFREPVRLPSELKGSFDCVIVDPPFLSEDCQTKAALTVRWLSRPDSADTRLIVCTGERMSALVTRLYGRAGVRDTDFEVRHAKGLSNEFRCYANFEREGVWRWASSKEESGGEKGVERP